MNISIRGGAGGPVFQGCNSLIPKSMLSVQNFCNGALSVETCCMLLLKVVL